MTLLFSFVHKRISRPFNTGQARGQTLGEVESAGRKAGREKKAADWFSFVEAGRAAARGNRSWPVTYQADRRVSSGPRPDSEERVLSTTRRSTG